MKSIKKTVSRKRTTVPVKKVRKKSIQENNSKEFTIVAIGASAGGLEAFKSFLSALPANTGSAFVLIMHLDPKHKSLSSEILSRLTSMPVCDAEDAMEVKPDHLYVIPSDAGMGILHGKLTLIPRQEHTNQRLIDYFFRSLADDQKDLSVGVILSGSGSDGREGIKAIKANGGMTFAQTPNTAKFDEMPKNAIATGAVDRTLPPEAIAQELAYHHNFYPALIKDLEDKSKKSVTKKNDLNQIYLQLRNVCHVDFTYYKSNTFKRRLARQMALHRMNDIDSYALFLSQNPDAVKELYSDILIHVTKFFRDHDAYEALIRDVFPKIMKDRSMGSPIRIWIPGCSTGEEVYSIAICLLEFLGDQVASTPIQIFASDISEKTIQQARLGEYPESIAKDVSAERLNRFFTKLDNGCYKISKSIRDVCLFSRHDITVDAPFAKMDLISCRNLLIYLTTEIQAHVIPIFHYSLKPNGFLWLGVSETVGGLTNLFTLIDRTNKTYAKKKAQVSLKMHFPPSTYSPVKNNVSEKEMMPEKSPSNFQSLADQALQNEYPGVIINGDMEILEFRGRTVPFIEPVPGMASFHLLKMAKKEFRTELGLLIQKAKRENQTIKKDGLNLLDGKKKIQFNIRIIPIEPSASTKERFYFVHFENAVHVSQPKGVSKGKKKTSGKKTAHSDLQAYIEELQEELNISRTYQSSLIEKFENTQENLTTANEELQSANEELQSANEEMETAKEELQSTNEELTTVNDELQSRSVEQIQLSNDLINLLGSIEIPILMLGSDFCIRRFTPLAGKILNLLATDVGRPISDLKLYFTSPHVKLDLNELVTEVLHTLSLKEVEIQDRNGRWFRLQVRPYKTIDNKIDGIVLALVDIHGLKESLQEVIKARAEAEKANRGKDLFLATLSHELRTPLTSILSWAQMIRMGRLDAEKTKKGIAIIEESGKAQAQLINDLLDVSRIIAGKLTLELCEINPISSIMSAIEAVRSSAAKKSIKIETDLAPDVGTIMADPVRLQQIFWNLLSNAIKFSEPNSSIIVKLLRTKDEKDQKAQATIQVCDTGKGVDPNFLPHIFDRFSQQDSSSIRTHGGLGLGLAIVKNLVELHNGKIIVESLQSVPSTTFSVFIPIKSNTELPIQPQSLENPEEINLEGIKAVILDDELYTREAFSELLLSAGAECVTAESVQDALEKINTFLPDIILSDIAMPLEDGYSLIKRLRSLKNKNLSEIPVIAITAFAGKDDIQNMLAAGFNAHLAKPVDAHDLVKYVCNLVKEKR